MRGEKMDFGDVVRMLKAEPKRKFARRGWNGRGMYVSLQVPDEDSANTLPYIWMRTAQGDRVPWLASQTDMLAEDWYEETVAERLEESE